MELKSLRCLFVFALAAWVGAAYAQEVAPDCQVEPSRISLFRDRAGMLSRYEQLPQHCLKRLFMRCAADANAQFLDFGSAAACSIGYEALLKRGFAGDFQALLAWWRAERNEAPGVD